MAERSIQVYGWAQESAEKFDYFLCGVTGGLFAYLGEHYTPRKLEFGISAFEPLALCLLVAAFFAGLRRIEYCSTAKRLNHDYLDAAEKAGKLTQALAKCSGSGPFYNSDGGEFTNLQELAAKRDCYMESKELFERSVEKVKDKANTAYKVRNSLLYFGFLALLLSKLLVPYAKGTPVATKATTNSPPSVTLTNTP